MSGVPVGYPGAIRRLKRLAAICVFGTIVLAAEFGWMLWDLYARG